jgi:photosystem II stability/assembly factor-like uncharacterized protein
MRRLARPALAFLLLAAPLAAQPRGGRAPQAPAQDPLRFQILGPAGGGRFASVAGVPGDPRVLYLGAASGGVWKSVDSGGTWLPVFDRQRVQAIGALAVAPTAPNMVWAGTGEAWAIRDADVMGDGIYLSADSGATWTNMGLRETGRIGRIVVHPTNPNTVYVCALGRATGPQQERGVYKSTDAGKTWQRVLFVDENTGCSGLNIDRSNPNVLFAGMWQVVMHTYAMYSGGPSSAIYKSTDGGSTWTKVAHAGLPQSPVGKIDVMVAPTDSKRVYALIQTKDQGSLWRSDDGGAAWRVVNWQRGLIGRAGYYIKLDVSPVNADEVIVANSSVWHSTDGGKSFAEVPWGGDTHDIWWDPKNPDRFAITNDAGTRFTSDHGRTWLTVTLPIAQMYHVAVDDQTPYWVYGNRQDNGTMRGPSTGPERVEGTRGIPAPEVFGALGGRGRGRAVAPPADSTTPRQPGDTTRPAQSDRGAPGGFGGGGFGGGGGGFAATTWDHGIGGCESGFTLPDLTNTDIVWASCYGNTVTRWDAKTKTARSVAPWRHTLDSPPQDLKYRCHWTPPLAIDPFDHETVYYGCQVVFKTNDRGQTWKVLSPDLSTRDPSRVVSSGGVVEDNLGQFYGEVVFAIAPSEIQRGLVWAGTNDGKIWNTRDGGTTWNDVTKNVTGLPTWGTVRKIEPSRFDAATAYVAVDVHMMDDRKPYVFKTTDYGKTWKSVTGDLPSDHPLDYVMAVAENPNRKGMLFAGTGHGFYYSLDDGAHWTQFQDGLPASPVSWIATPNKRWHDVVVSTYGRGVYVLRDIAPLEHKDRVVASAPVTLYPPRVGYREARSGRADITFSLAQATPRPVTLDILDSAGAVIRTLRVPTRAGVNRTTWDLRYEPPKAPELRTVALENPHIFEEPRFRNQQTRPITHWGIQQPQSQGPLALPGRYTVRLTVDSSARPQTQPLTIIKDSELASSPADLAASTRAQLRIRNDIDSAVAMINRLETMRKQIDDQRKAAAGKADVLASLDALEKKMLDVELQLVSKSDLNSDDKYYVEKYRVYMNLIWLSGEVGSGAGDVAGGAEYRPTDASLATLADIEKDLAAAKAAYVRLMNTDVPEFNRTMQGKIAAIAIM